MVSFVPCDVFVWGVWVVKINGVKKTARLLELGVNQVNIGFLSFSTGFKKIGVPFKVTRLEQSSGNCRVVSACF